MNRTERVDRIARVLLQHARPIILESYAPNCCIASTAIALSVFRCFGIHAVPASVEMALVNRPLAARLLERSNDFPTREEVVAWEPIDGSWAMGLGFPPDSRAIGGAPTDSHWPGHLVTYVEKRLLLDLTLGQATRPDRGMTYGPSVFPLTTFSATRYLSYEAGDSGIILLRWKPDDRSYEPTPDWRRDHGPIVKRLVKIVHKEVATWTSAT